MILTQTPRQMAAAIFTSVALLVSACIAAADFDVDLHAFVPDTTYYTSIHAVGDRFLLATSADRLTEIGSNGSVVWSSNQAGPVGSQVLRVAADGSIFYVRNTLVPPFGPWQATLTRFQNGAPAWTRVLVVPSSDTSRLDLVLLPDQRILVSVADTALVYDGAGNLLRTHALESGRRLNALAVQSSTGRYALLSANSAEPSALRASAFASDGSALFDRAVAPNSILVYPTIGTELLAFSGAASCSEPAQVERIGVDGLSLGSFALDTPACHLRLMRSAVAASSANGKLAVLYPTIMSDGRQSAQLAAFDGTGNQKFALASELAVPASDFLPPRGNIEFLPGGEILALVARSTASNASEPSGEATVVLPDGTVAHRGIVHGSDVMSLLAASFDGELSVFGRNPANNSIARLRLDASGAWAVAFDAVHTKGPSWPFASARVGSSFVTVHGNLQELRLSRISPAGVIRSSRSIHAGQTAGAMLTTGAGDTHFLTYTAQETAGYVVHIRRYEGDLLTHSVSLPQSPQSLFPVAAWHTSSDGLALVTRHNEPPYYRFHRMGPTLSLLDSGTLPWQFLLQGFAPQGETDRFVLLETAGAGSCAFREHDAETLAQVAEVPFACPGATIHHAFLGKHAGAYRVASLSAGQLRLLRIGADGSIQSDTPLGTVEFADHAQLRGSAESNRAWVWVQNTLQQSGGLLFGLTADQQVAAAELASRNCIDVATDIGGGVRLLCHQNSQLELHHYAANGAWLPMEALGSAPNNGFADVRALADGSALIRYPRNSPELSTYSRFSFRDEQIFGDGFDDGAP